jgi:hypothetical protein
VLGLAPVIQFLAHPRADFFSDLGGIDRRIEPPAASTADCMSGYCSLQASNAPSSDCARWTWPSEAAAAGWCSNSLNLLRQSGPSSAIIRRLTKAQPMGGASLCSFCNSAAYSGGKRSGMVAISWATFISGPLRLPSADASADASAARLGSPPTSRLPA